MSEELKNTETIDETIPTDESKKTEEQNVEGQKIPYERFKQKVDEANALKEKIAEIERKQEEEKRKELEEQAKYKELYEKALADAEQAKADALIVRKKVELAKAGYEEEQVGLLIALVDGETSDEIAESIEKIKSTIPVKDNYADPSAFNGEKEKPKQVGAEEYAQSLFERVKNKIR